MRVTISDEQARFFARRALRKKVGQALDDVLENAQSMARQGPYATGELARKTRKLGPVTKGDNVEGSVGTLLKYGRHKDQGTKPHVIKARKQKSMYFYWRKKGAFVYFKKVNHPGYKGDGWLTETARIILTHHGFRYTTYR